MNIKIYWIEISHMSIKFIGNHPDFAKYLLGSKILSGFESDFSIFELLDQWDIDHQLTSPYICNSVNIKLQYLSA